MRIVRRGVVLLGLIILSWPAAALAQSVSPSYKVDQTFFGAGGELDACGSAYCAKQSVGETAVGNTAGTAYQAFAGFNTTDAPYLEFAVTGSNVDLGYLNDASASTATGTFSIRAWQSGGYVVRNQSDPPSNGTHTLTALSSPTASSAGTEQFGINLKANTSPTTFGADPQQTPDSSFAFGAAATGYNTANQYKYAKGDTVALSTKSSSITIFTVSYIFNISTNTPSGKYTFNHVLVATATY